MASQSRFFYGYVIVAMCFLLFMTIMGLSTSFGLFFNPLIKELGWTRTDTSGAFSANIMVGGIFGIIGGLLSDKLGPRIVLPIAGAASALGYYLISHMSTVWQFYIFFGLIGGMGSNVYVPALSSVARWFVRRRSMMSGIAFSGSGFGLVVMPVLINWFLSAYGWRQALVIMSIIILLVTILAAVFLRSSPSEMGLLPYGARSKESKDPGSDDRSISVKTALASKEAWLLFLSLVGYGFCFFAFQVHIAVHATDVGISSAGAASILTALGVATIVGQLGLGGLGDKFGYKRAYFLGLCCVVLAAFTIIFATQLWTFFIFAALLGLAFGNCSTQESPLVAWLFGLASHGTLLGFFAFSWTCGAAIGPLVFGYIYDHSGSYQYAFWIAAILSVSSVVLTLFLRQSVEVKAAKRAEG
jgi:MFS family permease